MPYIFLVFQAVLGGKWGTLGMYLCPCNMILRLTPSQPFPYLLLPLSSFVSAPGLEIVGSFDLPPGPGSGFLGRSRVP